MDRNRSACSVGSVQPSFIAAGATCGFANKELAMNKSIRSKLAVAAVAVGSLWAVQAANAHTDVQFSIGIPVQTAPVYVQPAQPVYVQPAQPVYVPEPQVVNPAAPTIYVTPGYGFGSPWEQQRAWREAQWRQQQWREHEWRERERREHQWREQQRHEQHEQRRGRHDD